LARVRDAPKHAAGDSPVPLPTLILDVPELLKAVLKIVVAAERALDGPEDLAHETTI
jgi:hypothetical protein